MAAIRDSPSDTYSDPYSDPERLTSGSEDSHARWPRRSDSQPDLPSPDDEAEHCSLECEEDVSCLGLPERLAELSEPAAQPFASHSVFVAEDARTAIQAELDRQNGLRCSLVGANLGARSFAASERPRIVSWFVEVVAAMHLSDNTLHTAVSLLDRFVANTETMPPEHVLQLLAIACLSLATKHEEVNQFRPDDWVALAVDSARQPLYNREDLKRMEWLLLETVDWRIRVPNTLTFLRHFSHVLLHDPLMASLGRVDPARAAAFEDLASFLAEMSLLYNIFLPYSYSTIATACLVLAEWNIRSAEQATAAAAASAAAARAAAPLPHQRHTQPAQRAAAVAVAAAPPPLPPPPPQVRTVAALTELTGDSDSAALAPNLPSCVESLHQLYAAISTPGPDGSMLSGASLGLLAPVVYRYMPRP